MVNKEVSKVYAGALMDLGEESGILSQIQEELGFLTDVFMQDRDLMIFLNAPVIAKEDKKRFVDKIFSGKLSQDIVNFLKVLIDNDRQSLLPEIHSFFIDLIDIANNTKRVQVISSSRLERKTLENIEKAISSKLGMKVLMQEEVNEKILGGIILKIDDKVIDGSILKDLKNIREKLLDSKVGVAAYED